MRIIRITVVLLLVVLTSSSSALAQGIQFFEGSYEEACKKARNEQKNIFVDVYTSWCGPCKKLSREVFPQQQVGDYYNRHFVAIKLDAEKEADSAFFQHFKASGYPSLFWVDPESQLLDSHLGFVSPEQLIELGQKAVKNRMGERAVELENRWNSGERSYELLQEYAFKTLRATQPEKIKPIVVEYMEGLSEEERLSKESLRLIQVYLKGSPSKPLPDDIFFRTFAENADHYYTMIDNSRFETGSYWKSLYLAFVRIPTLSYRSLQSENPEITQDEFIAMEKKIENLTIKHGDLFRDCYDIEKLLVDQSYSYAIAGIENLALKCGEQYPIVFSSLLYSLSASKYFLIDEKPELEKVIAIAEKFLKLHPCKESLMYYAIANYHAGNEHEAISAMAWLEFYPKPMLSNAYFPFWGLENIRARFPSR